MSRFTWACVAFLLLCLTGWIVFGSFTYVVDQRDAAIVSLFGEVKATTVEPGLYFKNPVSTVTGYRIWIHEYNKQPSNTVTKDKKNIRISFYVKYRIQDVLQYAQTVGTKQEAEKRIDDVVYSTLKTNVSLTPFDEIVSNRGALQANTLEMAEKRVKQYGIHLIDFRIKRTDLPENILASVYRRMTEERRQMAELDRSEGRKQKQIMTAEADKRQTEILSEAYEKKQKIMGDGDREALRILTEAYGQDVEFAMYLKTLDLYRESLKAGDTTLVLSTKNELLQYLKGSKGAAKDGK